MKLSLRLALIALAPAGIASAQPQNNSAQPQNNSAQPQNNSAQPQNNSAQPAVSAIEPANAVPATTSPAVAAEPSSAAQASVSLPDVADPMLAPVVAPAHVLGDWREALRLVRTRSTSLRSAELQVTQAAAQARQSVVRYYPTLRATGSVNIPLLSSGAPDNGYGFQQGTDTTWRGSVSFRQPLINLQAWHDADTAKISEQAASFNAQDAERRVLAGVADTIVAVVTAERLAEVSRVGLRSSLSTLDLTRRRAQLGAASAVDVLRAEQEVALNRQQVVGADENLYRARESLGMALGYPEQWGVTPQLRLDEVAADAAALCSPVSTDQRSDIQALKKQQQAAERAIQSADYQLAPTLDLTSDYSYNHPTYPSDAKPMQWSIGALLTIPIYDGGARGAQRMLQQAQAGLTAQQLEQRKREVVLETTQAKRAVEVAGLNYQVSRESQRLSRETSRLAQLSFVNGRGTSFELVEAARRYQQAELDLAVKEFEVVRAKIIALLAEANCDI